MGYLTSPARCCCQICADCCNGSIPEFDVTITLVDSNCDVCDTSIGGTFAITPRSALCSGIYGGAITPITCATVDYVTRSVYYREVRLVVRCQEPYWIINVYMTLYMQKVDPTFGTSYIRNDYWWRKQIDATGVQCADICEDLALIYKTNYPPFGEWICDPGALNDLTCNVCAVP